MSIVYQHIRLDTEEVFYVGVGVINKRAYSKYGRNTHWWNIVNKFGYRVEIIYDNLPHDLALKMEEYLISSYGRKDNKIGNLVNKTDGGKGLVGFKQSKESIEKRVSKWRGTKRSPEIVEKVRLSNIGKKRSLETRKKNHLANIGKVLSEEHKQKISRGLLKNNRKGIYLPGKKVINVVTGKVYQSAMEASREIGVPRETFRRKMLKNELNFMYL